MKLPVGLILAFVSLSIVQVPSVVDALVNNPAKHHRFAVGQFLHSSNTAEYATAEVLQFVDEDILGDCHSLQGPIFDRLSSQHSDDCEAAQVLAIEEKEEDDACDVPSYEWIFVKDGHPLAVETTEAVLDTRSIDTIRNAAEELWRSSEGRQSRFTYQRPGNYEAHVSDLSAKAKAAVNSCLTRSLYPLVRHAFYPRNTTGRLCVYDALVIRYNATEASAASLEGAGQPLHRDLGIVSVNIMLNKASEFVGGGTFFENQLRDADEVVVQPLKPKGLGHCLAHASAERHAGSAISEGVRDILVLFITEIDPPTPPSLVQNALLKQCRAFCQEENESSSVDAALCRIRHQRLAVTAVPNDGEAWQYLGTALIEFSEIVTGEEESYTLLTAARNCLEQAKRLTPCDARVYNNLAITLGRLLRCEKVTGRRLEMEKAIEEVFKEGWTLLERSEKAQCDVTRDFDSLALNYGLHVSMQDRFKEACEILHRVAIQKQVFEKQKQPVNNVVDDACRLYEFCLQEAEKSRGL